MSGSLPEREVIFEIIRCGNSLKYTAIDVQSAVEVSIIAPLSASKADAQAIATRKLFHRLEKRTGQAGPDEKPKPDGIIV